MVANNVFRRTFPLAFVAMLVFPAVAAAQTSTVDVLLDRTGTPGTKIITTTDPMTGDPIEMVVDTGAFVNPCTGENVDVTGTTTISSSQTIDKFGTVKVNVNVVSKGAGRGWVGADYQSALFTDSTYSFSESQSFAFRLPAVGEEFSSDFNDKFALRGAKSVDNWTARAHFRIKVNADGSTQVLLIKTTVDPVCKG